jgi:hypothetical protein
VKEKCSKKVASILLNACNNIIDIKRNNKAPLDINAEKKKKSDKKN